MAAFKLPPDFKSFTGNKRPVDPDQRVELLIMTAEGVGSSGPQRARDHEWKRTPKKPKPGDVVGYRLMELGEAAALDVTVRL